MIDKKHMQPEKPIISPSRTDANSIISPDRTDAKSVISPAIER